MESSNSTTEVDREITDWDEIFPNKRIKDILHENDRIGLLTSKVLSTIGSCSAVMISTIIHESLLAASKKLNNKDNSNDFKEVVVNLETIQQVIESKDIYDFLRGSFDGIQNYDSFRRKLNSTTTGSVGKTRQQPQDNTIECYLEQEKPYAITKLKKPKRQQTTDPLVAISSDAIGIPPTSCGTSTSDPYLGTADVDRILKSTADDEKQSIQLSTRNNEIVFDNEDYD